MQKYQNNVQTTKGTAIRGASVFVYKADGSLASLYRDNGITPMGNPVVTDADGEYSFYVENGRYSLTVIAAGYVIDKITDFSVQDVGDLLSAATLALSAAQLAVLGVQDDLAAVANSVNIAVDSSQAAQVSALAALGHSADAAESEYNAVQSKLATERFYPGSYATDPLLRPEGTARQVGDMAWNSTAAVWKRWSGAAWVASDLNPGALAASGGSALVGFLQAGTGAVARTQQSKHRDMVSVKDFGAVGNGISDDTAAIQAAITASSRVHFPKGIYKATAVLNIPDQSLLFGDGISTVISFSHAGDGFSSEKPINTSNSCNITLCDMEIKNTNGANMGGGFVQTCGSYINLSRVIFRGWKHGTVLDQSEHVTIRDCQYHFNTTCGVWLVNGPTRSPGMLNAFTNLIAITGTQFNANLVGIIDDGGAMHSYTENNFNGGGWAIWVAGAYGVTIADNSMEYSTNELIRLTSVRFSDLTAVGQASNITIDTNSIIMNVDKSAINLASCRNVSIKSNYFETTFVGTPKTAVTGIANVQLSSENNRVTSFFGLYDAVSPAMAQTDYLGVARFTKTQFYSPVNSISAIEAYCPSSSGGGTGVSGIDFAGNNSAAAKVTYGRLRGAIYGNAAGAENGGFKMEIALAGVMTEVATWSNNGLKLLAGFGCNTKSPQASAVVPAAATDAATTQALVNALRAALVANGICA